MQVPLQLILKFIPQFLYDFHVFTLYLIVLPLRTPVYLLVYLFGKWKTTTMKKWKYQSCSRFKTVMELQMKYQAAIITKHSHARLEVTPPPIIIMFLIKETQLSILATLVRLQEFFFIINTPHSHTHLGLLPRHNIRYTYMQFKY